MQIPTFTVDAFTDRPFSGNPAAVCLLESVSFKISYFMRDCNGVYHSVLDLSTQQCIRLCFLYSGVLLASVVAVAPECREISTPFSIRTISY